MLMTKYIVDRVERNILLTVSATAWVVFVTNMLHVTCIISNAVFKILMRYQCFKNIFDMQNLQQRHKNILPWSPTPRCHQRDLHRRFKFNLLIIQNPKNHLDREFLLMTRIPSPLGVKFVEHLLKTLNCQTISGMDYKKFETSLNTIER